MLTPTAHRPPHAALRRFRFQPPPTNRRRCRRRHYHRRRLQRAPRAATRRMSMDSDFDGFSHKVAICFPGQGAQYVGMCKDVTEEVPAAKELFDKASEILGYDLLDVCVNGPKEKLDTTAVSQPAIFVASMAAVEKMKAASGQVRRGRTNGQISMRLRGAGAGAGELDGLGASERSRRRRREARLSTALPAD